MKCQPDPLSAIWLKGILPVLCMAAVVFCAPAQARAQDAGPTKTGDITWTETILPEGLGVQLVGPHLILGSGGQLHMFFSGGVGLTREFAGQGKSVEPWAKSSIFYFAPGGEPVDILYSRTTPASTVELLDVAFEPCAGELVVLWRDQTQLLVSTASEALASQAPAWATEVVTSEATTGALAVAEDGSIYVLFGTRDGSEIHLLGRLGASGTWREEASFGAPAASEGVVYRIHTTREGGLWHITWSLARPDSRGIWGPQSVEYARLMADTLQIEAAETVWRTESDHTVDFLSVSVNPNGDAFRTWSLGAGSKPGRYQQRRMPDGEWGVPEPILGGESGKSGYNPVYWDSIGTAYQVSTGQDDELPSDSKDYIGVRLYALRETAWTRMHPGILRYCEAADVVVYRGNEVHLACGSNADGIRYLHGKIAVEPLPAATPSCSAVVAQHLTAIASPTPTPEATMPTTTPAGDPLTHVSATQLVAPGNAWSPLLTGALPPLLLVVAVFTWRFTSGRRQ